MSRRVSTFALCVLLALLALPVMGFDEPKIYGRRSIDRHAVEQYDYRVRATKPV